MSTAEPERARPQLEVGYWLSSEEHGPRDLVAHARLAEEHGFGHAMISDHYHPWVPAQGHSSFVWGVLGAIGQATERLHVASGVTTPLFRVHPAVVAQAAATAGLLLDGRFALGLGTGERLNEHVVGGAWPRPAVRRRRLRDAIDIIRRLLDGEEVSAETDWCTVEHARVYSRPVTPPELWIAASGPRSAKLAGELGDGLIALHPSPDLVAAFESAGGDGKPAVAQLDVCWAEDEDEARATAHRWWPNGAMPSGLHTELARPQQFEEAAGLVDEDAVARNVLCGPDPEPVARAVLRFAAAGYRRVYVHQVGPDQAGFLDAWERSVRPLLAGSLRAA